MAEGAARGVLVTGANRSGTTWVGQMLCASGQLYYVYEPFNPGLWPRWTPRPVPFRNLYVCRENEDRYRPQLAGAVAGRRPVLAQVGDVRSARDAARLVRDAARSSPQWLRPRPTLVKDPIAVFSAAWLADTFDLDVVVTVRNPGAYVSSIKRLGWRFDFRNWLHQELLMSDLLGPFEGEIAAMARARPDLVDEAVLQWRAHYFALDRFRREHPDWHFVSWETLAADPVNGFRALYDALDLRFGDGVIEAVQRTSGRGNPAEGPPGDPRDTTRDSVAALSAWRHRLTADELARVRDGVADVAPLFYDDEQQWAGA